MLSWGGTFFQSESKKWLTIFRTRQVEINANHDNLGENCYPLAIHSTLRLM